MFSIEENEKLRREKMRGGDFKEKSSESSNENSDPDSPNATIANKSQEKVKASLAEEKKLHKNTANKRSKRKKN